MFYFKWCSQMCSARISYGRVHGECARLRANILGSYTTNIREYHRALMPRKSALYPVEYTMDIDHREISMPRDTTQISVA